jgi:hypothetical protein
MEVQSVLVDQRAEVDADCSANTTPVRKPLLLLTLDIPQRIADVLQIEVDTLFFQAGALAAPITEQMAMRACTARGADDSSSKGRSPWSVASAP